MTASSPPRFAQSPSGQSAYFTPRGRMSPSRASITSSNSVSSRVEMFESRASSSTNSSPRLNNGNNGSPRPRLGRREGSLTGRSSIAELWPGENVSQRRESEESVGGNKGVGTPPVRGPRDTNGASGNSARSKGATSQNGSTYTTPTRIPRRTTSIALSTPDKTSALPRSTSQPMSLTPSRLPVSRAFPRDSPRRSPLPLGAVSIEASQSSPPNTPIASSSKVPVGGSKLAAPIGSRRTSYQLASTSSSPARSRPSSDASTDSLGKKPMGPRPTHKSRSSITSITSTSSLGFSDVCSGGPTSEMEPEEDADQGLELGSVRTLSPQWPSKPHAAADRSAPPSPAIQDVCPTTIPRRGSRESLPLTLAPLSSSGRDSLRAASDIPSPSARRAARDNILGHAPSPTRPKMDPARKASARGGIDEVFGSGARKPGQSSSKSMTSPTDSRRGASSRAQPPSPTMAPAILSSSRSAQPSLKLGTTPTVSSPNTSPPTSPKSSARVSPRPSPGPLLPSPASRSDRKSPGLSISTPPPPAPCPSRSPASPAADRPSPPIPAKNPLRRLSRTPSGLSDRSLSIRSVSGDSTAATAGTPTTIEERRESIDESIEERRESTATERAVPRPDLFDAMSATYPTPPRPTGPKRAMKPFPELETDDIRFTTLTVPSIYSQDSEPNTARSFISAESDETAVSPNKQIHPSSLPNRNASFGWGKKRQGIVLDGMVIPDTNRISQTNLPPLDMVLKILPDTPRDTPTTATTEDGGSTTAESVDAVIGHTPRSPRTPETVHRPLSTRSPSMPLLGHGSPPASKAARLLGMDNIPAARAVTDPPLLPPAMLRSPTTPNVQTLSISPGRSSLSKRGHLIREIATSERAYANDLALIRDAFLSRYLRPVSTHSLGTNGDSNVSPGNLSDNSRRSSLYTYQTAETKRSSGHSLTSPGNNASVPTTPIPKSPSESFANVHGGPYGYFPASLTASALSVVTQPQLSPRVSSLTSTPQLGGKPLSPTDLRAIFLNLEHLTRAAEELANEFEKAIGEDEGGSGASPREGESGTDRLGEVFVALVPRLRPLFLYYCSRQAIASARLVELQADPGHAAYLKDCWALIKPHTHAWNLDSMLIKPVQRITKYPLLFDDLLASTTPVHPDYFNIRSASELARSMATEIDEAKRRKDVVAGVIKKTPVTASRDAKQLKGKGLKIFRKDKLSTSTTTLANITPDPGQPSVIAPSSFTFYREQVARLEEVHMYVKQAGKEIVLWTSAAKEVFVAEEQLVRTWSKVIQLEPSDPADKRLAAYRKVAQQIVADAWAGLNEEVTEQIIPTLSKLLHTIANPKKVIGRRDAKASDYAKWQTLREARRPIDRAILDSARDFVALHTQLVEDLPPFLEGFSRIFDLAIIAFARTQATFHQSVRDAIARFAHTWVAKPRRHSGNAISLHEYEAPDITTGRGIVKAWHEAWAPYAEAMEHFQCTRPARILASKMATFSERPGSLSSSRAGSRPVSPTQPASRPRHELRHSNSINSHGSLRGGGRSDRRPRPSSLLSDQVQPMSPKAEAKSKLLRSSGKVPSGNSGLMLPPPSPHSDSRLSAHSAIDPSNRYSFGLPRISPVSDFDALGLPRVRTPATPPRSRQSYHGRTASSISVNSDFGPGGALGLGELGMLAGDRSSHTVSEYGGATGTRMGGPSKERTIRLVETTTVPTTPSPPLPSPTLEVVRNPVVVPAPKRSTTLDDAGEGWRNEPVLYQCGVVADFDPRQHGSKRYRKLHFLPIITGDIIDVFYEVGRIDELPSFPYLDVGVDNDGVLVGRAENGDIGLVICSFLEPLIT